MRKLFILIIGLLCVKLAFNQNEIEALRYSYLNYSGTARFNGMGGAMGALGADMSATSINPAGIARFRKSELSISPTISAWNTKATFNNNELNDSRVNFNISNFGAVFTSRKTGQSWKSFSFGLNYNRVNEFQSNIHINGINDSSSMLDVFTNFSHGLNPDNIYDNAHFGAALAYDTWLLDWDSVQQQFYPWYRKGTDMEQTKTMSRRGNQSHTDITFGGNYDNKILLGGSIGFPGIRYLERANYSETPVVVDSIFDLESYNYYTELRTRGSGVNFKLGAIFVPVEELRLGLALHTPTWFSMRDEYSAKMSSNFVDDSYSSDSESDLGIYEYRITTPGRIIASAAYVFGQKGLVSLDYEYIDYAGAKLKPQTNPGSSGASYNFTTENQVINDNFQSASNVRVGLEYRVSTPLTVRLGYGRYASPLKKDDVDMTRTVYSAGLGYRTGDYFIDFAYALSKWKDGYYMYDPALTNRVDLNNNLSNFTLTAGVRF